MELDEAAVVRQIFTIALNQYSPRELGQMLADRGIRSKRGVYADNSFRNWADGRADAPSRVILAVARITRQSLDAPLGLASEIDALVREIKVRMNSVETMLGLTPTPSPEGKGRRGRGTRRTSPP